MVPENIHTPTMEGIGNSEGVVVSVCVCVCVCVGGGGEGSEGRSRKFQSGGGLDDKNHFPRG